MISHRDLSFLCGCVMSWNRKRQAPPIPVFQLANWTAKPVRPRKRKKRLKWLIASEIFFLFLLVGEGKCRAIALLSL